VTIKVIRIKQQWREKDSEIPNQYDGWHDCCDYGFLVVNVDIEPVWIWWVLATALIVPLYCLVKLENFEMNLQSM
jgi:hypothetical protein